MSALMLAIIAPFVEDITELANFNWKPEVILWVLLSALLAFVVNLSIFLVIGNTSPVSYNVLGHFKLCVIIASGFLLFGDSLTPKVALGVLITLVGIVYYTKLKLNPATATESVKSGEDREGLLEMSTEGVSVKGDS